MVSAVPFASPAQQRYAHAAKERGEDWAQGFTAHGDAYMREAKKKGVKHGPYSKHRDVSKAQPRYGGGRGVGRRIPDEQDELEGVSKAITPKKVAIGAGIAGTAGLAGYSVSPAGQRIKRQGKAAGYLYRTSPEFRSMSRAERKAVVSQVGKARQFDPEHRRQRHIGAAQAALLGAGGVLGFKGTKGIVGSTRALRAVRGIHGKDEAALKLVRDAMTGRGVLASPKHLAMVGGGVAGVGGAGALQQHSMSRRGRAYL